MTVNVGKSFEIVSFLRQHTGFSEGAVACPRLHSKLVAELRLSRVCGPRPRVLAPPLCRQMAPLLAGGPLAQPLPPWLF